ncbi:unnamed protein product [Albugo candida]|uniref:CHCH domain-containing protein n=1 Tax=Albugo candida TaxID=65357 RepID=A0A024GJT9_9STRA|nr:unnamed protein product [Albugo candida]|eukprot:CCI47156.1 unnamed protein product [Albugo candida]
MNEKKPGRESQNASLPCVDEMDAYLKCVNGKIANTGGLRDGDECQLESELYRACRQNAKKTTSNSRK